MISWPPERMDAGWAAALAPVSETIEAVGEFLRGEEQYLPAEADVFRAFQYPFDDVRVLIVGQDPYPTPGHPIGLSFAVDRGVRPLPRSLSNIYRELADDTGVVPPQHGDLTRWSEQGVMLLNRVLTVRPGAPASHRGRGWEAVTDAAISAIVARDRPLVAVLWGAQARALTPLLGDTPVVSSAHPSPLSASRGFFGSRPFSKTNMLLSTQGSEPIDWTLE